MHSNIRLDQVWNGGRLTFVGGLYCSLKEQGQRPMLSYRQELTSLRDHLNLTTNTSELMTFMRSIQVIFVKFQHYICVSFPSNFESWFLFHQCVWTYLVVIRTCDLKFMLFTCDHYNPTHSTPTCIFAVYALVESLIDSPHYSLIRSG